MDNSANKSNFEEQWQKAFEEVEMPPAPRVWKNIEGQLDAQTSGHYRKGFLFYRSVAAAFLLCIAGLSWYILSQHQETGLTDTNTDAAPILRGGQSVDSTLLNGRSSDENLSLGPITDTSSDASKSDPASDASLADLTRSKSTQGISGQDKSTQDLSSQGAIALRKEEPADQQPARSKPSVKQKTITPNNRQEADASHYSDEQSRHNIKNDNSASNAPFVSVEDKNHHLSPSIAPVASNEVSTDITLSEEVAQIDQLYRVPEVPTNQKKERQSLRFFAGLTITPNYFDPQFEAAPGTLTADLSAPPPSRSPGVMAPMGSGDSEQNRSNISALSASTEGTDHQRALSFSYGLDVGMALSEHWIVESGVDYNRFSTTTNTRYEGTNVRTGERFPLTAFNNYSRNESDIDANPTAQTDVNNTYEFVSIPMKVGYRFNLKRVSLVLSSGVAANFFVKNAIASSSERFATANVYAQDIESPFNRQYLSGLLSGGVHYNIISRYHVSFTPSYAFALTDLTREDSDLSSQPYSLGMNVGFRYVF